ncbi:LLM class flavin-dependent oxidoreductase [Corynebacterium timonense]|uniref:Luciferase-like monooxygenase n=1 Tax=Corynebacterium timonense TaxID=441500 RepID=A0A1H1M3B0_9CORY|nr:LLM class flavin-dependent oxidoreductase [Corynebacterium timonense]SDR81177.1 Luciferase-like monooxygenase [Corynebacterium timonense]
MTHTTTARPSDFIISVGLSVGAPEDVEKRVRLLDASGIDLVTLADSFVNAAPDVPVDASTLAPYLGARTRQIGIVPEISTTHTEPFHVSTATASLDYVARARGEWLAAPSLSEEDAAATGRRPAAPSEAAWAETVQVIDVVRKLWTSWDADAEIRDARTGRFLDLDRVNYVDATLTDSVGKEYTIKGPSITPQPPQGTPPVFVRSESAQTPAAAAADVVLLTGPDALERARAEQGAVLPALEAPAGAAEIGAWFDEQLTAAREGGLRGVHLEIADNDAAAVRALATLVRDSNGRFGHHAGSRSLRARLGLA